MRVQKDPSGCRLTDTGCYPYRATVYESDGSSYVYDLDENAEYYRLKGSTWGGYMVFNANTGRWTLRRNRLVYQFDGFGYQTSLSTDTSPQLRIRTYTYSSPRRLSKVTDVAGRTFLLTWGTNQFVEKVTDPAGKQWTYSYNASNTLSSVTSPGSAPSVRTYHYESPVSFHLLTGASINGRWRSSRRAGCTGIGGRNL